jgi:hypothetical protein
MLTFSNFLIEAAGKAMAGSFSQVKGQSHVLAYVAPFLSAAQKQKLSNVLKPHASSQALRDLNVEKDGEFYSPDREHTHEIVAKKGHGDFASGTKVKVTGIRDDNGKILAQTEKHGEIPLSKLGTPSELARGNKTDYGFEIERELQKIDPSIKPAGSTGESHDFAAGDLSTNASIKGKAVKKDISDENSVGPLLRGEAKTSETANPSMGTITANWHPERGWEMATSKSKMAPIFAKAVHPETGLSLIDHLNKIAPNGINDFNNSKAKRSIPAPQGTTRHYLENSNVNALHLHLYKKKNGKIVESHGTTYTVGDNNVFKNRLGMAHLEDSDLNSLDGTISIERSGSTIQIKHKPNPTSYRKIASAHKINPEGHSSLHNEESRNSVRQNFVNTISELRASDPKLQAVRSAWGKPTTTQPQTRTLDHEATFAGKSYHSPDEQKHILGLA